MADRQDASASLNEVRATLLRVADRLSAMEETPSPSKYRCQVLTLTTAYVDFGFSWHQYFRNTQQPVRFAC